jgi:hypothetical protein
MKGKKKKLEKIWFALKIKFKMQIDEQPILSLFVDV